MMIEEHVRRIVVASRGDEQTLIHTIAQELLLLRAALPSPAYLESVAAQLDTICVEELDLPDGTTFDGRDFLRHAARLVRLALIEEVVREGESFGGMRESRGGVGRGSGLRGSSGEERTMQPERGTVPAEIERDSWKPFLDDFSKRNQLRPTRLEVIGKDVGAQQKVEYLPLVGVTFEPKGSAKGSVEIILGPATPEDPRHMHHLVLNVQRVVPIVGIHSMEDGLGFEDGEGGKTLLHFENLPELPETGSESRGGQSGRNR